MPVKLTKMCRLLGRGHARQLHRVGKSLVRCQGCSMRQQQLLAPHLWQWQGTVWTVCAGGWQGLAFICRALS